MKKILLAVITVLTITGLYGQSTNEQQIRNTLNDYIEGSSYNKVDQIKKAFADNATLYLTNREGEFKKYTPLEYTGFFKNGTPGKFNGRVGNILEINIEKDIATARAQIVVTERKSRYIDLFLLKNIEGKGWKIVSKTATASDYLTYVPRNKKLDNFTLQRLIVMNDAGEILMEQGEVPPGKDEHSWFPMSLYSNKRQSINEAMDSLALSRGIKITNLELRGYTTYKFTYHDQVSFRSYYVAKHAGGTIKQPEGGSIMKWLPTTKALPNIPVEAIRLITKQVLEYPKTIWGGSFLISENGEQHDTVVLEKFYPLFGKKP